MAIMLTTAGLILTDDTQAAANDTGEQPCGGSQSGDLVYEITPQQSGTLTATLDGSFATLLYVRDACPGGNNNLECDNQNPAVITMAVTMGTAYYLFVDGFGGSPEEGPFTLTLELQ
jgi:hypothetical protein